jgi:hypothetical protein
MPMLPAVLQNCASVDFLDRTLTSQWPSSYPVVQCNGPWMYLGADQPYGTLDIDGDGLQDLLLTSVYGAAYGQPDGTWVGKPVTTGLSDYYTFLNAKFSTRSPNGVVAPFSTPLAQQDSSPPVGGTLNLVGIPNVSWRAEFAHDLPNICVGPQSSLCGPNEAGEVPYPGQGGNWTIADPQCGTSVGFLQEYTFGDINGDGIPDRIRRATDHFDVWYGHGDGVFGVCNDGTTQCDCSEAHSVTFVTNTGTTNTGNGQISIQPGQWATGWTPYVTGDPNLNVQFHDVDGDGFDDAIVPTVGGFDVYFILTQAAGAVNDVTPVHVLAGADFGWANGIANASPYDSIYTFADMDGSGVDDVILESWEGAMGYVNVLGGERPGLLEGIFTTSQVAAAGAISTPTGISTAITYSNLPTLSRQAAGTINAWTSQSPQSMHVVTDLKTVDTTPGIIAFPAETQYVYSNPVYDGRDRQFVGFTSVEAINVANAADYSASSMHTKTTYFQGHCNDSDAAAPCPQSPTPDYPNHALRGLPLLTETYGDSSTSKEVIEGAALSTIHRTFIEDSLYLGMDKRYVNRTYLSATDTYWYDNSTTVKRTLSPPLLDVVSSGTQYSQLWFMTAANAVHTRVLHTGQDA